MSYHCTWTIFCYTLYSPIQRVVRILSLTSLEAKSVYFMQYNYIITYNCIIPSLFSLGTVCLKNAPQILFTETRAYPAVLQTATGRSFCLFSSSLRERTLLSSHLLPPLYYLESVNGISILIQSLNIDRRVYACLLYTSYVCW